MMDVTKLTPAPWKRTMLVIHPGARAPGGPSEEVQVVDADGLICRCELTRDTYEIEEANADFIALARNAFDVLLRRGWGVEQVGQKWFLAEHGFPQGMAHLGHGFDDPFTCLVEADRWYQENVERHPGT